MGVISYETETRSSVPPGRLFKAVVLDANTLIPKIMPQSIKCVEVLEGDGGPGSIRKITFAEGLPYTYSKNKTEALDIENFMYKYSMIEGDVLPKKLEKITTEIKIVPGSDGGSVFKTTTCFYTVGEAEVTEEEINNGKEQGLGMFRAIEAYLLANSDVCN